jgi:3'-phosphoadenosine 5'-phosphosulfate sulfotransferase (PAPS reductase)/FAD synthetase
MPQIDAVIPVSGGKDSETCVKLALEHYSPSNILGLFCDTKFEHPETYRHIKKMEKYYGVTIITLCAGSVPEEVVKAMRFPGGGARHCTDRLKLRPSRDFYQLLAESQGQGFEVWCGMRSAESTDRAARYSNIINNELYPPHEILSTYPKKLQKLGVMFRLPIIDWTTHQVFQYLDNQQNPLYAEGFTRVGCFPCLCAGDKEKNKAFQHDDFGREQRVIVTGLEKTIGKSVFTSKREQMRNNHNQDDIFTGCGICAI